MTLWNPSLKERVEAKRKRDREQEKIQARADARNASRRVLESKLPGKAVKREHLEKARAGTLVVHRDARDPELQTLIDTGLIKPKDKHAKGQYIPYKTTGLGLAYLAREENPIPVVTSAPVPYSGYGYGAPYDPKSPPALKRPQARCHLALNNGDARRDTAAAQRNVSQALRDAEENPFKIDTGWLTLGESHPIRTLFRSATRRLSGEVPLQGFTGLRHVHVATRLYRRHFNKRVRPSIDVLTFHALGGGGAVILRGFSDELVEVAPIHDAEEAAWAARWRAAGENIPRDQWPELTELQPDERFIFLGTHPGIETFLTMEFR